ncbi:hypothetical protein KR084_003066 [Drosophila pseudotakahashii]|nr:hypothetical protein KR084_003066 [Drosophila pseudotakahashii]
MGNLKSYLLCILIACILSGIASQSQKATKSSFNGISTNVNRLKRTYPGFVRIGNSCFFIEDQIKKTWIKAKNACRRGGGDLAVIQHRLELEAIVAKFDPEAYEQYWLGVYVDSKHDLVTVPNGNPAPYIKWDTGRPILSSYCVSLSSYNMLDKPCRHEAYFVCQLDCLK